MKKKLIAVMLCIIMCLSGCGGKKAKSEYDIDEFLAVYSEIFTEYDKETEYWTDDEHREKGNEKFISVAKKYGFSPDMELTISGCLNKSLSLFHFFNLVSKNETKTDGEKTYRLMCQIDSSKFVLFDDGEILKVKGTFLSKDRAASQLVNCEILSPSTNNIESNFKNNVDDLFSASKLSSEEQLEGTIVSAYKIEDYDPEKKLEKYTNYDSFSMNYKYADYIVFVGSDTSDNTIPVFISLEDDMPVTVGRKIVVYGRPETSLELGDSLVYWHTSYLYYTF